MTSLKQLNINKATGSDGIPVRLLKETADQIILSLTMLFNKSLLLGIFAGDWNIVPVLAGLRDHITHLISREQHGFLASRSCVTQLTSVLNYIGSQLNAGKQIDIIYLDMNKALDKVDHTKLLGRLHQYSITGKLHDWFRSYLHGCNRLQSSDPLSRIAGYIWGTTRVPTRADIVSVVCG